MPSGEPPSEDFDALTPLQILLTAMREKWAAGDHDGAVAIARAVAPYLHARPTTTNKQPDPTEPNRLTDADLEGRLAGACGRAATASGDPDFAG